MRFYNREKELEALKRIKERSEYSSTFTVIMGRRRIGKTTLMVKSAEGDRSVYLFVSRVAEPLLCEKLQKTAEEARIEIAGSTTKFRDLFKALMISSREEPLTIMIDEFQDLKYVNPAIYGEIQEIWDLYKDTTKVNLIVCGSVHSMMVGLFEDSKEPLFGRATSKIELRPFPISVMKTILKEYNPGYASDDILALYMLTGGVPEYLGVLMDSRMDTADKMIDGITSIDSVFIRDGRDLVVSEFGRDYRTYFSIMQLIAGGKNRRGEIDSVLGMETGAYLRRLEDEYSFIRQSSPIFSEPGSRNARFCIADMYLRFYFRFILPYQDHIESGRRDLLNKAIRNGLDEYSGRVLEDYFRQRIVEEEEYTEVGSYWSRKGDVEIDIIVLNDLDKTADIIEVKRNPKKLDMNALMVKAETVKHDLKEHDVRFRGLSIDDV
ncbi:MAG: ATP-binding protein [Candidatus Methanoplasma sp.]|jgi:AAA+ ATPase superfamily predicted ATPase|nr:ATP-binding protein [Candidatus Methanoplasma sp.]